MAGYRGFGVGQNTGPTLDVLAERQEQQVQQASEDAAGFWGAVGASASQNFIVPAAGRAIQRSNSNTRGRIGWSPDEAQIQQAKGMQLTDNEMQHLFQARDSDEYAERMGYIQEDRTRRKAAAELGTAGNLVMSMLDPAQLVLAVPTGGTVAAGAIARAGLASKAFVAGGALSAATESLIVAGDTDADVTDVILAGVLGGAVTGGLSAAVAKRAYAGKAMKEGTDLAAGDISPSYDRALQHAQDEADAALTPKAKTRWDNAREEIEAAELMDLHMQQQGLAERMAAQNELDALVARLNDAKKGSDDVVTDLAYSQARGREAQAELDMQPSIRAGRAAAEDVQGLTMLRDDLTAELSNVQGRTGKKWKAEQSRLERELSETNRMLSRAEEAVKANSTDEIVRNATNASRRADSAVARAQKALDDLGEAPVREPGAPKRKAGQESRQHKRAVEKAKEALRKAEADRAFRKGKLAEARKLRNLEIDAEMGPKGLLRQPKQKLSADEWNAKRAREDAVAALEGEVSKVDARVRAAEDMINSDFASKVKARQMDDYLRESNARKVKEKPKEAEATQEVEFEPASDAVYQRAESRRMDNLRGLIDRAANVAPRATKIITDKLSGTGAYISRSRFKSMRGLGHLILANAQTGSKHGQPAAVHMVTFSQRIERKMQDSLQATEEAFQRAGFGRLGRLSDEGAAFQEGFRKQVVLAIKGIPPSGPYADLVARVAKSEQDAFAEALKIRKQTGVVGWDHVSDSRDYWSVLPDSDKMKRMIAQHGQEEVADMIAESYLKGARLSKMADQGAAMKLARILADGQIARSLDADLSRGTKAKTVMSQSNRQFLKKHAKELGLTNEDMDNWLQAMEQAESMANASNRAKFTFGADITHSNGRLGMLDILNTDSDVVFRYGREAAADSSLAKVGLTSRLDVERMLEDIQKESRNIIYEANLSAGETKKLEKQLAKETGMIRDGVKQLYGESLEAGADGQIPEWVKFSRNARQVSSIVSLGQNGLASIPEMGNVLARVGLVTALRELPALMKLPRNFRNADPVAEAWMDVFGAYGHVGAWMTSSRAGTDVVGEMQSQLGRVEKGLHTVSEVNQTLSLFKNVQHGLEEMMMRSTIANLDRAALSGKVSTKMQSELARAGLPVHRQNEFFDAIATHRTKVDGHDVPDFSKIDRSLLDDVGSALNSQFGEAVQRQFIGETPSYLNREFGRMALQFLTFPIVAVEKQLARGIRMRPALLVASSLYAAPLAYAAYMAASFTRANASEDKEAYLENALSPENVALGVVNRMGPMSLMQFGLDAAATAGFLPSALASGPNGVQGGSSMAKAPSAVGVGLRTLQTAGSLARNAASGLFDDDFDEEQAGKDARKLLKTLPVLNTLAVQSGFAALRTINEE